VYRIFKDRDDLDEQIRATIIADLMVDLAPVLALEGTIEEAINRAVTTYVRWVIENPPLHQFLGGGAASRRNTNSKVVTGTKAAIAVHVAGLIDTIVRAAGHDPAIADSMSFGLVGLVDASVNRWVAHPNPNVTSDDLIAFLTESIWLVIRAAAKNMGLQVALETPLNAVS
jgi:AcrR family transcriptional regulator